MKNYSEPIIELLALSPTDIIQNSPPVNLTGNELSSIKTFLLDIWVISDG